VRSPRFLIVVLLPMGSETHPMVPFGTAPMPLLCRSDSCPSSRSSLRDWLRERSRPRRSRRSGPVARISCRPLGVITKDTGPPPSFLGPPQELSVASTSSTAGGIVQGRVVAKWSWSSFGNLSDRLVHRMGLFRGVGPSKILFVYISHNVR